MHKALKIATIGLSLLILFNSVGIAIYEHTCNFKNETARSLYKEDACCSKKETKKTANPQGTAFQKTECCDTDASVFVPNVFQSSSLEIKFVVPSSILLQKYFLPSFLALPESSDFLRLSDCSGPPLSARSSLYVLYQVFVI